MEIRIKTVLLVSLILLFPLFGVYPSASYDQSPVKEAAPVSTLSSQSGRTVNYRWYKFFDVPQKADVWAKRNEAYAVDTLISADYPVIYDWEPAAGWHYFYTSARLNVSARQLPEISIDDPEFIPYNLLGGMPPQLTEGTARLNWYLEYVDTQRATELKHLITGTPLLDNPYYDGYITEFTGDIVMDKNATMKILGIGEAQYSDIIDWWTTNNVTVQNAWSQWLLYQGNVRFDLWPFFQYPFSDYSRFYIREPIELSYDSVGDLATLSFDFICGAMECLLARWFWVTFMPGYEYYYNDLTLGAVIGPSTTNLDLDTEALWASYMWSYNDTAFEQPVWVFEPVWGDRPDLAWKYNQSSPGYAYYKKTYFVVTPGNDYYGQEGEYDYCPAAWNLREGETLSFDWSNVYQKGPVWIYRQLPWSPPAKPIDSLENVTGQIKLSETAEPYPLWGDYPSNVAYDVGAHELTFVGPMNMTDLSWNNIRNEWLDLADPSHPVGIIPYGEPYLEFKMVQDDVAVASITPSEDRPYQGQTVKVNVTTVNLGANTETFSVTAKYDGTTIGTQTVTSLPPGQTRVTTFDFDTGGLTPGVDYTLTGEATMVGDDDTTDNVLVGTTVKVPAEHDVAITSVTATPTTVIPGQSITIRVNATNEGNTAETFDVTASRNLTAIDTKTVTDLAPQATETLNFVWDTTGLSPGTIYTIRANASVVSGETITDNNVFVDGTVSIPALHDVAIKSVTASPSQVARGQNVTIVIEAKNEGLSTDTFDVTAYFNETSIQTTQITLAFAESKVLTYHWNTTSAALGNYTISATASTVPGETDLADNTLVDGIVRVKTPTIHDIAIVSLSATPAAIKLGGNVTVTVVVKNLGTETESFNLRVYGNVTTLIGSTDVLNLLPGTERTLSFTWITSSSLVGKYTVSSIATTVAGETNALNNNKSGPIVTLESAEQPGPSALSIDPILIAVAVIVVIVLIALALYMIRRRR